MKKTKKRGFTIVELVIVIAVIAILAAVMVPTFSNVISKAKESKLLQEARGAWDEAYANHVLNPDKDGVLPATNAVTAFRYGDDYFEIDKGVFVGKIASTPASEADYYIVADGTAGIDTTANPSAGG